MSKKVLKCAGICFSLCAMLTLVLPMFSGHVTGVESWNMVIKGYNLIEFSAWGSIVLFVPIVLVGLMLSKLNTSIKNIGMMALLLLDAVALYKSSTSAYNWALQQTSEQVQIHPNQFLYIGLLLVSLACFYVVCNYGKEEKIMSVKDFFLKEKIVVEPVDFDEQNFFTCLRALDFAKYTEDGAVTLGECKMAFANDEGYFVALNDDDKQEYFNIEALEDGEAIGYVMGNMPTGLYGRLYEDYDFRTDRDVSILKYPEIYEGEAELYIPQQSGGFTKDSVKILSINPNEIIVGEIDGLEVPPAIGALVMQGEELAAIVVEYDAENHNYKCISAHIMAIDLCRKIYEHKVFQQMQKQKLKG